jgi:hypothetical protein
MPVRQRDDDEIGDGQKFRQGFEIAEHLDPRHRSRAGAASNGHDPWPERTGQSGHFATDVPHAEEPDRRIRQFDCLDRLPRPLTLQLHQLRQPPADRQNHRHDVLGDRHAEDSSTIGHGQAAQLNAGRQHRFDPDRHRVNPAQLGGSADEPIQRVAAERPAAQQHLDLVDRLVRDPFGRYRD